MKSKKQTAALIGAGVAGAFIAGKAWSNASRWKRNRAIRAGQEIVILGARFAGMNVARELSKLIS
jgi:hypothetical protein